MLKCLIFVQGLTAQEDGEIRTRILSKLEQNLKISLQIITEECEQLENLWHDMMSIEEHSMSKINPIKQKQCKEKFVSKINPCYDCGQIHYYKECPFRRKECFNCDQKGHKHTHCRKPKNKKGAKMKNTINPTKMENTEIKIKRKVVKVQMNNKMVRFQLDTSVQMWLW